MQFAHLSTDLHVDVPVYGVFYKTILAFFTNLQVHLYFLRDMMIDDARATHEIPDAPNRQIPAGRQDGRRLHRWSVGHCWQRCIAQTTQTEPVTRQMLAKLHWQAAGKKTRQQTAHTDSHWALQSTRSHARRAVNDHLSATFRGASGRSYEGDLRWGAAHAWAVGWICTVAMCLYLGKYRETCDQL